MYSQLHKIIAGFSKGRRSSPVLVLWQPVSLVQVCEQERCVRTGINSCRVLPAATADVAWSKHKRARGNTLTETNPCGLTAREVPLNGKQEASCSSGSFTSPELLPRCHGSLAKSTHPREVGASPLCLGEGCSTPALPAPLQDGGTKPCPDLPSLAAQEMPQSRVQGAWGAAMAFHWYGAENQMWRQAEMAQH